MNKYWFKPKDYGWGISWPISWQGWVAFMILVGLIFLAGYLDGLFDAAVKTVRVLLRFAFDVTIVSTLFCLAVNDKVEGGLGWRWGGNKK